MSFYHDARPHQALGYKTPARIWGEACPKEAEDFLKSGPSLSLYIECGSGDALAVLSPLRLFVKLAPGSASLPNKAAQYLKPPMDELAFTKMARRRADSIYKMG